MLDANNVAKVALICPFVIFVTFFTLGVRLS